MRLFLFSIITLVSFSSCFNGKANYSPVIQIDSPFYDLGKIHVGDSVTHDFNIKNVGSKELIVFNVSTSCGCTTVSDFDSLQVPIFGSKKISVKFKAQDWQKDSLVSNIIILKTNTDSTFHILKLFANVVTSSKDI